MENKAIPPFFEKARLIDGLKRLRAEAHCANELERGHLLWRLSREFGGDAETLSRWGFEAAYRRIVDEDE